MKWWLVTFRLWRCFIQFFPTAVTVFSILFWILTFSLSCSSWGSFANCDAMRRPLGGFSKVYCSSNCNSICLLSFLIQVFSKMSLWNMSLSVTIFASQLSQHRGSPQRQGRWSWKQFISSVWMPLVSFAESALKCWWGKWAQQVPPIFQQ